jgi:hypothetical protein
MMKMQARCWILIALCACGGGTGGDAPIDDGPLSACGKPKPGPHNTGVPAGTTLTPSGSIRVEQDGAIVEDLDIDGAITILADNVTIRRERVVRELHGTPVEHPRRCGWLQGGCERGHRGLVDP